ncbi:MULTISPECIES: hypothetical protein [unclassified Mycobacterium]|uniref:hypothetical protein n=1 Tax=unclassified Mycobacterium TaxID=2642494 RepID=UPI0009926318|nr:MULTISPECIES: hypothetical protein [unclassified Mycobacterium]
MIDWDQLGQPAFDRYVEALIRYRFGDKVRAVNGRGGDEGIDIEVRLRNDRLWIMQLKYYPEGFSSMWGQRRASIKKSYQTAQQHNPVRWSLIAPCLCTAPEANFVRNLGGGQTLPAISILDRDDLDTWAADSPNLDSYVQRTTNGELERLARIYTQEQAALLGGVPDALARVRDLGGIVNSTDLDWAVDIAASEGTSSVRIRPRDPDAPSRSPITLAVELGDFGEEHAELNQQLQRNIGYATTDPVHIPRELVERVVISGPDFVAGEYPPGDLHVTTAPSGAIGGRLGIKAFYRGTFVASYEGAITHAAPGLIGGSIEADFCDSRLQLRLRLPRVDDGADDSVITQDVAFEIDDDTEFPGPGIDIAYALNTWRPSAVEELLATARVLSLADKLECTVNGEPLTIADRATTESPERYNPTLIVIEQYAGDLAYIQRKTSTYFDIPEATQPADRVKLRVARLLLEGHVVADPRAELFTMKLTGADTPETRASLQETRAILWDAGNYVLSVAGRDIPIGPVYVTHPAARTINGAEAIAALDAGNADGFEVKFEPGNDPYFYVTLADVPKNAVRHRSIAQWTLQGITQPGVDDDPNSTAIDDPAGGGQSA